MIKRMLKWAAVIVVVVGTAAFGAFLYFIPPFFTTPPEAFTQEMKDAAPLVSDIADPKERVLASRGRDIVMRTGCIGCHMANGPQGPDYSRYLAGGGLLIIQPEMTFVSRNLTPDPETGLARRSDEEVKRVLRSGLFPDGHVTSTTAMPSPLFSNWTAEDQQAVLVYLRHLKPVHQNIPEAARTTATLEPGVVERDYGFKDYSIP
jgi:mono/diheme cytochrome c family protein